MTLYTSDINRQKNPAFQSASSNMTVSHEQNTTDHTSWNQDSTFSQYNSNPKTATDNNRQAEIRPERRPLAKTGYLYLIFTGFCLLFSIIYEHFSHNVTSPYMTRAFLIPLVCGALPSLALSLARLPLPEKGSSRLWHFGIITLTIGSLVRGILDIYGTTNQKVTLYLIAGIVFLVAGMGSYVLRGLVRYRSQKF